MVVFKEQGRKRPLDTPKRMLERREREKERYVEGYREECAPTQNRV